MHYLSAGGYRARSSRAPHVDRDKRPRRPGRRRRRAHGVARCGGDPNAIWRGLDAARSYCATRVFTMRCASHQGTGAARVGQQIRGFPHRGPLPGVLSGPGGLFFATAAVLGRGPPRAGTAGVALAVVAAETELRQNASHDECPFCGFQGRPTVGRIPQPCRSRPIIPDRTAAVAAQSVPAAGIPQARGEGKKFARDFTMARRCCPGGSGDPQGHPCVGRRRGSWPGLRCLYRHLAP